MLPRFLTAAVIGISMQAEGTRLEWQHDWKSACERAALERKPILVCVLSDSEPVCQKMFDKITTDAEAMKKLWKFVLVVSSPSVHELVEVEIGGQKVKTCARYPGVLCSEHQALEKALRDRFLDPATGGVVIPQFGVFDAEGKLLLKREYVMKKEGFLEFLAGALAIGGDPAALAPSDRARSPLVQRMVDAILDAKDDGARELAARELFSDTSPERESALRDVLAQLKSPAERGTVIRAAGWPEQKAWAPAIATLLADKDPFIRNCAVVTLEEERNPAVVDDLLAAWTTEKDPEIRKDLLRALGPCGGGKAEAKRVLLEELASTREKHRVASALALGSFLKGGDDVAAALQARWQKEMSRTVRLAILWGVGESEDDANSEFLERLMKGQKDADLVSIAGVVKTRLHSNLKQALKSLGKGGGQTIRRLLGPIYDDDKISRNMFREADARSGKH